MRQKTFFTRSLQTGMLLMVITVFFSCKNKKAADLQQTDTPKSGRISIVADESFAPLLRDEITTFSNIYEEAQIDASYLPERNVTDSFFSNENIRLMIIARRLQDEEKMYFEKSGLPPREIKIAIDAVAFIVNKANADSQLTYEQVADILSGKITSWKQINPKSLSGKISVVFDNKKSSTVRFLSDQLLEGASLTANAFAVDSNPSVINYIKQDAAALGVIGAGWISSRDDTIAHDYMNNIRLVAVSRKAEPDTFFLPEKQNIYSLQYPFLRELFIISQEKHSGLGTGFATYVASDEGQRIVQRHGLLPIDKAVRVIELKDQF